MRTDTVYEEAPDVLSLDDIVASGITLEWYEAVALVEQICRTLSSRGAAPGGFPNGSSVTLTPEGDVGVVAVFRELEPATSAARMLSDLLTGEVPVRLRLAVSQAIEAEPDAAAFTSFADTLTYFARPDGRTLLREVHRRASTASDWFAAAETAAPAPAADFVQAESTSMPEPAAPSAGDVEIDGLAPVAAVPLAAPVEDPKPLETLVEKFEQTERKRRNRVRRRRAVLFAGCAAAVPVAAVILWKTVSAVASPDAPGVTAAARHVAAVATRAANTVTERVATAIGKTSKPAADRSTAAPPAVSRARRPQPARGTGKGSPARDAPSGPGQAAGRLSHDAAAGVNAVPVMSGVSRAPLEMPGAAAKIPGAADLPATRDEVIYSASTPDVRPPVGLRPHLPAQPAEDAPAAPRSVIELVVARSGTVESVRLLSKPRTFKDVMLLTAAKSWIFRPATLNGEPVRFRHQVVITVP